MSDFLPQGYVAPVSSGGYTKLKAGKNRFRILSAPLLVWIEWRDGKPFRHQYTTPDAKPPKGAGAKDSVNFAWAMIVWNYDTEKIEIFELDKVGCRTTLEGYATNPKWGHPKEYDIIIEKTGSGQENTKYTLTVDPKEPVADHIVDAYTETPIDLNQLLIANGNPFLSKESAANPANVNAQPAATNAKVVTPENWLQGDALPAGYEVNVDTGALQKKALPF
jgi:hypothetical protein